MLDVIDAVPALMQRCERQLLYALVVALSPARILEIGTHQGGSALIIGAALDEIGAGSLVCVDLDPIVTEEAWQRIAHRATLLRGASPAVLVEARTAAGGLFDLAFIDGDHEFPGVIRDIEGVLPLLADHAYLLFHDAHFRETRRAIDHALLAHPGELVDCGMLSVKQNVEIEDDVVWGGLRLLRHQRRHGAHESAGNGEPDAAAVAAIAKVIHQASGQAQNAAAPGIARAIDYIAECRALWRASDQEFVAGLYRLLLGRDASGRESAPYITMLAAGTTRLDIVDAIAFSDEARGRGLPTGWIDALAQDTDLVPHGHTATLRRRVTSWVRGRPLLAQLARYLLAALRLPWRSERTYTAGLQHQRELAELRSELRELSSAVRTLSKQSRDGSVARGNRDQRG